MVNNFRTSSQAGKYGYWGYNKVTKTKVLKMNDKIVDLTHTQSRNSYNENSSGAIIIQTLAKFDVDFEELRKEVNILDFRILKSQEKDTNSVFAEFESVSYKILFTTYNVEFFIRLLSFQNDIQCQILKLDIEPKTTNIKKEIEYCINSLQRRRNLDLMFKTLIMFGKFIESRRLICDLILKKNCNIKIEQNKDGGIIIVYSDEPRNVRLGIFWSIACSSTHDVTDVIEVYYKVVELPYKTDIKYTLNMLTEPCLDFTKKYHLWKSLVGDLSERRLIIKIDKMPNDITTTKEAQAITILSDSEDTFGKTLVTDADKVLNRSILKTPEGQSSSKSHNIKKSARRSLVVEIDIMPDSSTTKDVTSKCRAVQDQTINVLSDSEECTKRSEVQSLFEASKKSLIVVVDKMPATSSTDSQNEERICTEHTKENTNKRDTDVLTYLQLEKTSNIEKVENKNNNFVKRKPLGTRHRQISNSKGAELKSTNSSDSEILSDILEKVRDKTGTISLDSDSASSDSAKYKDSEDSENSEFSEVSVYENECLSDSSLRTKTSAERRRKKNKITLNYSRRGRRLSTVSNTKASSNLVSPSRKSSGYNTRRRDNTPIIEAVPLLRTPQRSVLHSSTPAPKRDVATSTVTPNKGLILLSDSSLLGSVLPNNLLNVITPKKPQAAPQKNIRIRMVPDKPVSDSPSFVELNLISPSKKPKVSDDDLEITSVTYIIPD